MKVMHYSPITPSKVRRVFFLALIPTLSVNADAASSDNTFPYCAPDEVKKDIDAAKSPLPDDSRFIEMKKLYQEIGALKEATRKKLPLPKGFITTCLESKRSAMSIETTNCTNSAKAKGVYHFILGQYLDLEGRLKESFDHFSEAAKLDPNDYIAAHNALDVWLRYKFQRTASDPKDMSSLTSRDSEDTQAQLNRLLQPLMQNIHAPKEYRIEAYQNHAALLMQMNRHPDAVADWKEILNLDPQNAEALGYLTAFEMQRGRKAEARKYLEQLAPLRPMNSEVQKNLIELQIDEDDYPAALRSAEAAADKNKHNVEIQALLARALAGNGRVDEAVKLSAKAYKAAPNNKVAQQTESYLHLINGEKWAKEGLPGKALAEFDAALTLNSSDKKLRTRMATLIFEQCQNADFKPIETTRKDLDRAVSLLEPLMKSEFVEQRTVEIYISSAAHSSKPSVGALSCDRYRDDFGAYPTVALVVDCATCFKYAGGADKAKKTLEDALLDPRFKGTTAPLTSALSKTH